MNVPATAFSSVDLPDPFVPMTMTNEPSSIVEDDAAQRAHLVRRAGVERLASVLESQHGSGRA